MTPRAKTARIVVDGSKIKVYVVAPPEDGRANREVCERLAEVLGVAKGAVTIEKGQQSRNKSVQIAGWTADEVRQKLTEMFGSWILPEFE